MRRPLLLQQRVRLLRLKVNRYSLIESEIKEAPAQGEHKAAASEPPAKEVEAKQEVKTEPVAEATPAAPTQAEPKQTKQEEVKAPE